MADGITFKTYSDWADKLPKCIGSQLGCDGDLVGEGHESVCPRYGLEDVTFFDAFRAGTIEGLRMAEEIALEHYYDVDSGNWRFLVNKMCELIRSGREKVERGQ